MEAQSTSFWKNEWEQFKTKKNLTISVLGGALMTGLVAWENRNNDFESYDAALVSRFLYTLIATHVILRVHEVTGDLLPEEMRLRKAAQVTITTSVSAVCTAVAQLVGNDPELWDAVKWTVGITAPGLVLKDKFLPQEKSIQN